MAMTSTMSLSFVSCDNGDDDNGVLSGLRHSYFMILPWLTDAWCGLCRYYNTRFSSVVCLS